MRIQMGRVIHFEVLADDPERASAFYKNALGWEVKTWSGGEQSYWLVSTGAEEQPGINGGIMGRHLDQAVINTVQVENLSEAIERVKEHGGSLVHGPNEIPEVGQHAYCRDTEGNLFGLLEPFERDET